ncbi:Nitronate monooxygenase-domain-containing protein [Aspergillus similis]
MNKLFPNTKSPFIASAPMFGYADGWLASAVSSAGGYGFIAGGYDFSNGSAQLQALEAELAKARALLGIQSPEEGVPIGVGCLTLQTDGLIDNALPILRKARVTGIWLSFPQHGADHGPTIARIRELRETDNWDVKVFVQVGTVQAAREAVELQADVLVVQGSDAGGHQWAHGASVMTLVPEVHDLLQELGKSGEVGVIAAGGIVDARGFAAALGLGAEGIAMGTRFIATTECPAPDSVKEKLLSTMDGATTTIKSRVHDVFQHTDFWHERYDGRAIIGPNYKDFLDGVGKDVITRLHDKAKANGEQERITIWAGTGIGRIKEVVPVKQLLEAIRAEAQSVAAQIQNILGER